MDNSVTGHTAQKTKKVQLLINIDRLCVRDAKDQRILFEHPLHMISFCADDKEARILRYGGIVGEGVGLTLMGSLIFNLSYNRFASDPIQAKSISSFSF